MQNPCAQDCPNRSATCHAECEEYAAWAKENEQRRIKRAKENDKHNSLARNPKLFRKIGLER